jgi:hypothetical protein
MRAARLGTLRIIGDDGMYKRTIWFEMLIRADANNSCVDWNQDP